MMFDKEKKILNDVARTLSAEPSVLKIVAYGSRVRGDFREDDVAVCATAITGILNMFILAHVFGGAPIDRNTPLHQVRYYICGLANLR